MPDDPEDIRRRAHAIWEAEGRPDGREKEHWAQAEAAGGSAEAEAPSYGEAEQPGPGHPPEGTGVGEAAKQAGEGNPRPSADDPRQRSQPAARRNKKGA
jgi:hypothetical protein